MKSWMECHGSLSLTFALSGGQSGGLWKLFGHGLEFKQYHCFTNGKIIVTLFMDAALVVTTTTAFKLTSEDPTMLTPFQALEINVSPPTVQLDESDIKLLTNLSLDGLKKFVSIAGLSTSKHVSFKLIHRYKWSKRGATTGNLYNFGNDTLLTTLDWTMET